MDKQGETEMFKGKKLQLAKTVQNFANLETEKGKKIISKLDSTKRKHTVSPLSLSLPLSLPLSLRVLYLSLSTFVEYI